ncbi:MAG: TIGR04282 family arsenosugar biosynthesis glycosyltransferase, partial [Antricoccus sp.]
RWHAAYRSRYVAGVAQMSSAPTTIIVMAKSPVAGQVKTRLCPPLTVEESAELAAAAIADTLENVRGVKDVRRVIAYTGNRERMVACGVSGFELITQRGGGFADRLANAFNDAQSAEPGPSVLIAMDTPQADAAYIEAAIDQLRSSPAVLGPATDGGWWLLGLTDPHHAGILREVPMSIAQTRQLTEQAFERCGIAVSQTATLRDVDSFEDARAVADLIPQSTFAQTLNRLAASSIRNR